MSRGNPFQLPMRAWVHLLQLGITAPLVLGCGSSQPAPVRTDEPTLSDAVARQLPAATSAPTRAPGASPIPESDYAAIIERAIKAGIPGIQAYVRRGSERWSAAAGVASVEDRQPMTLDHRIRLASITKMMTYATVMELVKSNALRRSDRAVDLLPPGTLAGVPYADEMTIAHLLDHTSGLYNFNGENSEDFFTALFGDSLRATRRRRPLDLIAYARDPRHPPAGRPGERRSYSSTGYSVLELILEHRTGKPFPLLLREHLFEPLGMVSAGVEGGDLTAKMIVDSYARPSAADRAWPSPFGQRPPVRDDGLVNLSRGLDYYNAWAGAAGSVAASTGDVARLMAAVEAGERIVLDDQERLFTEARSRADATFSWNGGSWGIQASIIHEPHRDITVIVLTNASNAGADGYDIARQLLLAARK